MTPDSLEIVFAHQQTHNDQTKSMEERKRLMATCEKSEDHINKRQKKIDQITRVRDLFFKYSEENATNRGEWPYPCRLPFAFREHD
jgi:hypothetical protein